MSAVAAILSIRLFLELTGYPKLGGGGLHIAHMHNPSSLLPRIGVDQRV
ncbi:MAG: hypothetical protein KIT09_18185 [Bryobacteraceae bacterium]|nr:hypothetical protein [Bryobacteraceae bacterium]